METVLPGVLAVTGLDWGAAPPVVVFARQAMMEARNVRAVSIREWAERIFEVIPGLFGSEDAAPWRLHVWPRYGEGTAGRQRCEWIVEAVREALGRRQRVRRRSLGKDGLPFTPEEGLIKLLLTAPDQGFLSVDPAPGPHSRRALLSGFPGGEIPVAVDKSAPSRAFAKLLEAELRLGHRIETGESCVDLGACPGSWTYVALNRGARVVAVDRSALREDLMRHPRLTFRSGDAFAFEPEARVDWLLCDVIAAPERSLGLVRTWLKSGWCRKFVVTIKFKGTSGYALLDALPEELRSSCSDFRVTRLCANRNEACVAGVAGLP